MGRVAVALSCTEEVKGELERMSQSRSVEVRLAERARIVLGCLRGLQNEEDLRPRILAQLELPPPEGLASWDGGSLAKALEVSDDVVWRVLRREGIQLQRHRSWCVSTDPEFAAKAADVIGLYLNPPEKALVLSAGAAMFKPVAGRWSKG